MANTKGFGLMELFLFALFAVVLYYVLLPGAMEASRTLPRLDPMHSVAKHGTKAIIARACQSSDQTYLFFNPTTKRKGIICKIGNSWGVLILDEAGREITAFMKEKLKRFDQIVRYMENAGYSYFAH